MRKIADERLTFEQKRRLADDLALLGRISPSSRPDADVSKAIRDAVGRVRKALR